MTKVAGKLLVVYLCTLFGAGLAAAQTEVVLRISVEISPVLELDAKQEALVFADVEETRVAVIKSANPVGPVAISHRGGKLTIAAETSELKAASGETIPVSQLAWRHSGRPDGEWMPLSTTAAEVLLGDDETAETYLDFRLLKGLLDPPGQYQGVIKLTLGPAQD